MLLLLIYTCVVAVVEANTRLSYTLPARRIFQIWSLDISWRHNFLSCMFADSLVKSYIMADRQAHEVAHSTHSLIRAIVIIWKTFTFLSLSLSLSLYLE